MGRKAAPVQAPQAALDFGGEPSLVRAAAGEPAEAQASALSRPLGKLFDGVPADWRALTDAFRASPQGRALIERVDAARSAGAVIYPDEVFNALHLTRRADVKVLILGQDPYHGPGQAHGLAFSVRPAVAIPPSLRNIRKEIQRDLGLQAPAHGCLQAWAEQGVLLLNTSLTVQAGEAGSHAGWGWELLTDALAQAVVADAGARVVMLWGAHAQRKAPLLEAARRASGQSLDDLLVLQSNHPSPLSATRGPLPFVGNGHFRLAAGFWRARGQPLDWVLD